MPKPYLPTDDDPKTITRWAAAGKIASLRTKGGHRRFKTSVVRAALLEDDTDEAGTQ